MEALVLALISLAAGWFVGRAVRRKGAPESGRTDELCHQAVDSFFGEIRDGLENCRKSFELDRKEKRAEQLATLQKLDAHIANLKQQGCTSEEELKERYPELARCDMLMGLLQFRTDQEIDQFVARHSRQASLS